MSYCSHIMCLTLPMSHYIFAVIFCAVLSLWILQQWIRKEVQALAEIINPLWVLKVLISAKQNTASILLRARRGDQSEIHSLWSWFAKPASKPLHTLSRFLFFLAEVNNESCPAWPVALSPMQLLGSSEIAPKPGLCREMGREAVLAWQRGHWIIQIWITHRRSAGGCKMWYLWVVLGPTRLVGELEWWGVTVVYQLPNGLEHSEVCGARPVAPARRSGWLVIAGAI